MALFLATRFTSHQALGYYPALLGLVSDHLHSPSALSGYCTDLALRDFGEPASAIAVQPYARRRRQGPFPLQLFSAWYAVIRQHFNWIVCLPPLTLSAAPAQAPFELLEITRTGRHLGRYRCVPDAELKDATPATVTVCVSCAEPPDFGVNV